MAWNLIFLIISQMTMQSAEITAQYPIAITGTVLELETVQDDISFYTWSVYLQLQVEGKGDGTDTLPFQQQGFESEGEARAFLGEVAEGGRAKVSIYWKSLEGYAQGKSGAILMEAVEAL